MRNTVLIVTVLAFTVGLQAKSAGPASDQAAASEAPTITGCLQITKSGDYALTDDDGQTHDLSGSTRKLRPFVGHEVELTGKTVVRTVDNTPPGGASSVRYYSVFEVKSAKQIADQCKY